MCRDICSSRTYYIYDSDTIVAELDTNGNILAEYSWGLLGPITRLDLTNPWGNLLKGSDFTTPNPFTWNGAFGYEWIEFTGLFHVGAREYDPRTARWLQRDPIGIGGGHPNVYLYCGNEPVNSKDPSGLEPKILVQYYAALAAGDYEYAMLLLGVLATRGNLAPWLPSAIQGALNNTGFRQIIIAATQYLPRTEMLGGRHLRNCVDYSSRAFKALLEQGAASVQLLRIDPTDVGAKTIPLKVKDLNGNYQWFNYHPEVYHF